MYDNKGLPYPTPGDADGLAFSSGRNEIPYSLQQIYNALETEGYGRRTIPNLDDWADQGVLLLNSCLTTRTREVGAHKDLNWKYFLLQALIALPKDQLMVHMAWGTQAQELLAELKWTPELVLRLAAKHPAAVKRGYIFRPQFHRANEWLIKHGKTPIEWNKQD